MGGERWDFSRINVIDIESTCWEGAPPEGETSDIIEVGIAVLRLRDLVIENRDNIVVQAKRSKVTPFCTSINHLTQERVDQGDDFQSTCRMLRDVYKGRERMWASYGDFDRTRFERQCRELNVAYPFGKPHLNIRTLFTTVFGLDNRPGTDEALAMLGLEFVGTRHNGGDDAYNGARILGALYLAARTTLGVVDGVERRGKVS
jgi:inhibitor of KinA sporulation pathway (predicted exonuclease)